MPPCVKRSDPLFGLIGLSFMVLVLGALFPLRADGQDPNSAPSSGQILNIEAPGNLESKYDLGCVGSEKLRNEYTPADLYRALSKCVEQGEHEKGAFLYALAGVYARFDALRVADKTAHQAMQVLQMQALGSFDDARLNALWDTVKRLLREAEGLSAVCRSISKIGPPVYYPRYMVQHGLDTFLKEGPKDGLVADFHAETAWKEALDSYLHCPGLARQEVGDYEAVLKEFVEHAKAGDVEAMLKLTDSTTRKMVGDDNLRNLYRTDTCPLLSHFSLVGSDGESQQIRDSEEGWLFRKVFADSEGKTVPLEIVLLKEGGVIRVSSIQVWKQ